MRSEFSLLIFIAAFSLIFISCNGTDEQQPAETTAAEEGRVLDYTTSVTFLDDGDSEITQIRAAVADDDHTRSEGLMNVEDLPEDAGMLFIFDNDEPRSFWMANTPLSLDIIFANSDFEIVRIHQNTPPYTQESFRSENPARYVVEVNAGFTIRHDIREGSYIRIGNN